MHDQLSTRKRGLPERNDDLSLQTTYCIFLFHLSAETVGGSVLDEPSTVARRRGRGHRRPAALRPLDPQLAVRSEEHPSELQSLMRISYAFFCLKKKKTQKNTR